ncbi:MAG: hypothetical protein ABR575_00790 [Actinomycetota bacterium]
MKRSIGGGAHRGPVAPIRQRRTLRFVQVLLVVVAGGLLMFAGYAWGESRGYEQARRAGDLGAPRAPGLGEVIALATLGLAALSGAVALQGDGTLRVPTPARLEELAGRAEAAAIGRAGVEATRVRSAEDEASG